MAFSLRTLRTAQLLPGNLHNPAVAFFESKQQGLLRQNHISVARHCRHPDQLQVLSFFTLREKNVLKNKKNSFHHKPWWERLYGTSL